MLPLADIIGREKKSYPPKTPSPIIIIFIIIIFINNNNMWRASPTKIQFFL